VAHGVAWHMDDLGSAGDNQGFSVHVGRDIEEGSDLHRFVSYEVSNVHEDRRLPDWSLGWRRNAVEERLVDFVYVDRTARLLPDSLAVPPMVDVVMGQDLSLDVIDARSSTRQKLI